MKILLVYNADTGFFNTLADIGHKIFSPETYQCDLCQLTHGYFSERTDWKAFIEQLDVECRFLHRDEFLREFPEQSDALPAIFIQQQNQLRVCMDSASLHHTGSIDELIAAIKENCCG